MSASLAPECNEMKERYDSCFLKWYSESWLPPLLDELYSTALEYLRGQGTTDECASLFKDYKKCLTAALKERGIDKMLDEARENHKENDAVLLQRRQRFMHPFSILTLAIFVAGYITARWDLVTRLYELAIFAWDHGVVKGLPQEKRTCILDLVVQEYLRENNFADEHDGLMRIFWPLDIPKTDTPGVIIGWRNSGLDVFVVAILKDVDSRNVENALKVGTLFRNAAHPMERIHELCGQSSMHVLGLANSPGAVVENLQIHATMGPALKVPQISCARASTMQIILFERPLPHRMQYISLNPISLALGDKSELVSHEPGTIDAEEERDELKNRRKMKSLVEKLKLHTVTKHPASPKELALQRIVNQINCSSELHALLHKNISLVGTRSRRSLSVSERVVESATTMRDFIVRGFVIGLVCHRVAAETLLLILEWRAKPDYAALKDVSATAQQVEIRLQQFCYLPMQDYPAGLKLNNELAAFLGDLFLWVLDHFLSCVEALRPILAHVIWFIGFSGFAGASMPIALFSDLLSLLTLHIYSFYLASARIFNWQYTILLSLFQLFRGKKHNVLRKRIDSCDYDLDQLLLGTILFTLLFFLLPTVIVFYFTFACARMAIISLKAALDTLLACLNHFPLFALMLRIKDSQRLPGGICFELRDTPQLSHITCAFTTPPTSHIYLKSVPLTFRAMFHQYFQLGHRIRKHYLSPRVLLCLATGKFVPPIHRKNLYSLQYSMLPARRSGIMDMWHALTADAPKKTSDLRVNGKRLNVNGKRH
ncbi:phosphatidylinositol N-acetylglucosaminyltransferase subunit GPI1 [Diplocarpon mali]|nr:phosphatidylinositol N-acetylglucosaminyltransferase subunit GPI1 [Diplocarpon mali]